MGILAEALKLGETATASRPSRSRRRMSPLDEALAQGQTSPLEGVFAGLTAAAPLPEGLFAGLPSATAPAEPLGDLMPPSVMPPALPGPVFGSVGGEIEPPLSWWERIKQRFTRPPQQAMGEVQPPPWIVPPPEQAPWEPPMPKIPADAPLLERMAGTYLRGYSGELGVPLPIMDNLPSRSIFAEWSFAPLADPTYYPEVAGEVTGFMAGLGRFLGPLGQVFGATKAPTLSALRQMPTGQAFRAVGKGAVQRGVLPMATLGLARGTIEGVQEPGATLWSVAQTAGTQAAVGGLFGGLFEAGRVPVSRLLPKIPSTLVRADVARAGRMPSPRTAAAKVLGVRETATEGELRTAYRKMAVRYHPDVNPDPRAADLFKQGAAAYETLMRRDNLMFGGIAPISPEQLDAAILHAGRAVKLEAGKLAQILASVKGGEDWVKAVGAAGLSGAASNLLKREIRKELRAEPAPEAPQAPPTLEQAPGVAEAPPLPPEAPVVPSGTAGAAPPGVAPAVGPSEGVVGAAEARPSPAAAPAKQLWESIRSVLEEHRAELERQRNAEADATGSSELERSQVVGDEAKVNAAIGLIDSALATLKHGWKDVSDGALRIASSFLKKNAGEPWADAALAKLEAPAAGPVERATPGWYIDVDNQWRWTTPDDAAKGDMWGPAKSRRELVGQAGYDRVPSGLAAYEKQHPQGNAEVLNPDSFEVRPAPPAPAAGAAAAPGPPKAETRVAARAAAREARKVERARIKAEKVKPVAEVPVAPAPPAPPKKPPEAPPAAVPAPEEPKKPTAAERRIERMKRRAEIRAAKAKGARTDAKIRAEIEKQHAVEKVRLQERLRAEKLQHKAGVKVSQIAGNLAQARRDVAEAIGAAKAKTESIEAAKVRVLDTLQSLLKGSLEREAGLKPEDRLRLKGRLLTERFARVKDAKTALDLEERASDLLEEAEHRVLVREVAGLLKDLRSGQKEMEEPYRGKVLKILGQYDPSNPTDTTIIRLEELRHFAKAHPEVPIPADRLAKLERLGRRPVSEMTNEELETLRDQLEHWQHLSETKGWLKAAQFMRKFKEDATAAVSEAEQAHPKLLPTWKRPQTWFRWLVHGATPNAETQLNRLDPNLAFGETRGALKRRLVDDLSDAFGEECALVRDGDEGLTEKVQATLGKSIGSSDVQNLVNRPVEVKLPTATDAQGRRVESIIITETQLDGLRRNLADPDSAQEIHDHGIVFRGSAPKGLRYPSESDAAHKIYLRPQTDMPAILEAGDQHLRDIGDWMQAYFNEPEYFKRLDESNFNLTGRHLQDYENWWHRARNRGEIIQGVPEYLADFMDYFPEQAGELKARTGSQAAVVIEDSWGTFHTQVRVHARMRAFAQPLHTAWMMLHEPEVANAIRNRIGDTVYRELEDHVRHIMANNLRPATSADAVVRHFLNAGYVAAMAGSITVPANQLASLAMLRAFYPAAAIARATARVLSNPRAHYRKMVDGDPVMWLRYHALDFANLFGEAGPGRFSWKKPLSEKVMMPVVWLDGFTQSVIYELAGDESAAKNWTAQEVNRRARFVTDHVNNSTTSVNRSGLTRQAAKSAPYRFLTWFKSAANACLQTLIQVIQDVKMGKKGAGKAAAAVIAAFVAMVSLLTVVGTGRRYLTSGGKQTPSAGGMGLDALENVAGNFYGLGDAVSGLRMMATKGTTYGYSPRANPLEQFTTETLKAAFEFGDALGSAMDDERYKSGPKRGERKAFAGLLRAVEHTYRASAYGVGLPLAPLTYGKGIYRFAKGAKPSGVAADFAADVLAENVAALKARKVTLAQARSALRKLAKEQNWTAEELARRLKRLTDLWRGRVAA